MIGLLGVIAGGVAVLALPNAWMLKKLKR